MDLQRLNTRFFFSADFSDEFLADGVKLGTLGALLVQNRRQLREFQFHHLTEEGQGKVLGPDTKEEGEE